MKKILLILVILLISAGLIVSCGQKSDKTGEKGTAEYEAGEAKSDDGSVVGKIAPEFTAPAIDGTTFRLSDYRGNVVFLDFWTTWCVPCRKEVPGFIELQNAYGDSGFVLVGVSLDKGDISIVRDFAEKSKMNYLVVQASDDVAKIYDNVSALPTAFLINPEGKVMKKFVGYHEKEVFEKAIVAELNKMKAQEEIPALEQGDVDTTAAVDEK
jgi:cytochrome c biogenesis protein CcmG/thiol:disulfide interchange protein DsbE